MYQNFFGHSIGSVMIVTLKRLLIETIERLPLGRELAKLQNAVKKLKQNK